MYSSGPLYMDEQRLGDQLEPIYNSSVPIQDIAWKTSRERWTIETGGERGVERSVLAAQHDDNCLLRIIISYLKLCNCLQIIGIK